MTEFILQVFLNSQRNGPVQSLQIIANIKKNQSIWASKTIKLSKQNNVTYTKKYGKYFEYTIRTLKYAFKTPFFPAICTLISKILF